MQYDVETPAEYLETLDDDWRRETLLELRTVIHAAAPGLTEGIEYKMLSYKGADDINVLSLNAQKNYVSLYVGTSSKIDPTGELLDGLECGKGCIRFKKSTRVGETRIREFVERAVEIHENGGDIGC